MGVVIGIDKGLVNATMAKKLHSHTLERKLKRWCGWTRTLIIEIGVDKGCVGRRLKVDYQGSSGEEQSFS